ncbi:universal stress protein [Roseivivax sp. CAU 1761]
MDHGTVAVLIGDTETDAAALRTAVNMTEAESSHLDVYCLAVEATPADGFLAGTAVLVALPDRREAERHAEHLHDEVKAALPTWRDDVQFHTVTTPAAQLQLRIGQLIRLADKIVVAAPYDADGVERRLQMAALDAALYEANIPVIVVPDKGAEIPLQMEKIAIAWDGSRAATAAVRAAIPMLRRAKHAEIIVVGPEVMSEGEAGPGRDLALFLARHGISTSISILPLDRSSVAEVIMRQVMETGAQSLVMGGYGRSQMVEAIFGGTTRDMLNVVAVPLILSR